MEYIIIIIYPPFFSRGILGLLHLNQEFLLFLQEVFVPVQENNDYSMRNISNPEVFKGNVIFGDFEGYIHILDPLTGLTIGRERFLEIGLCLLLPEQMLFMQSMKKIKPFQFRFLMITYHAYIHSNIRQT